MAISTLKLGELTVSHVDDGEVRIRQRVFMPGTTKEFWDSQPDYADAAQETAASVGGLLVEHGDRAILIDAGFGPSSGPGTPDGPFGPFHGGAMPDGLAELGRAPASIEAVAITHLHADHVGWLWQGDRPFAHAEVLVNEEEWAHQYEHSVHQKAIDAIAPQVRTVTAGEEIFPGVTVTPMPGHTPGHTAYTITGGGRRLIAFGDALHSPAQIAHPQYSSGIDHDPQRSAEHRRALAELLAEPDTMGYGVHFGAFKFGRVVGGAWQAL